MNKHTSILILLGISIIIVISGILFFLLFNDSKDQTPVKQTPSSIYYAGEFSPESSTFIQNLLTPLLPGFEKYDGIFDDTQKIVTFPVKYPKEIPAGFGLTQITAWKNEQNKTEGFFAHYTNDQNLLFILQETISFNPKVFPQEPQNLTLESGVGSLWEFKDMAGIVQNRLLLFDTIIREKDIVFYLLESENLTSQELVNIANSSL